MESWLLIESYKMIIAELVSNLVTLAKEVRRLVNLAKSNREQAKLFAENVEVILSSIQGLNELPQNQQFKNGLELFHKCLQDALDLFKYLSTPSQNIVEYAFCLHNASQNEKKLTALNETVKSLLPQTVLGLTSQILMDREKERQKIDIDRQSLQRYLKTEFEKSRISAQKLNESMAIIIEYLILPPEERPNTDEMKRRLAAVEIRPSSPNGEELYETGVALEKERQMNDAYQYYEYAKQKGYFKAITRIGIFHLNGEANLPVNHQVAETCFQESANCQHDLALYHLGRMYQKGYTKEGQNLQKALFFCRKALEKKPEHPQYQAKVTELEQKI